MASMGRRDYLRGVISTAVSGPIGANDVYRKYAAVLSTTTSVRGFPEQGVKRVLYEVGRRYADAELALHVAPDDAVSLDTKYAVASGMSDDFRGLARKYTNFSAEFAFCNLAPIVERVAKGLAAHSVYGNVTSETLRAGERISLTALSAQFNPVMADDGAVFIPRLADRYNKPNTLAVLVAAVAGEGGRIVTDALEVDVLTNQPLVPTVNAQHFPSACVDALRVLGANMALAGQEDLFGIAVARGLHQVLTVVSHTDEGGIVRDILRGGRMARPFGGISTAYAEAVPFTALPALSSEGARAVAGYVDSLLLATAAAAAHCDPGVDLDGNWFPTVIDCGLALVADEDPAMYRRRCARSILTGLRGVVPEFGALFSTALGKLFGGTVTNRDNWGRLFSVMTGTLRETCRHAQVEVSAPFFWIEPTGILPKDFLGSRAETHGSGSLVGRDEVHDYPAFPNCEHVWGDEFVSMYKADYVSARRFPMLWHFHNHQDNGLAGVSLQQADPYRLVLPGSNAAGENSQTKMIMQRSLHDYLWVRGQSPIAAPAELLNLGGCAVFRVMHATMDGRGIPRVEHMYRRGELAGADVRVSCSMLRGVNPGPLGAWNPMISETRNLATFALNSALRRVALYGEGAAADEPQVCFNVPRSGNVLNAFADPAYAPAVDLAPPVAANQVDAPVADDRRGDLMRVGEAVVPQMRHEPPGGPRLGRQPPAGGGGGAGGGVGGGGGAGGRGFPENPDGGGPLPPPGAGGGGQGGDE